MEGGELQTLLHVQDVLLGAVEDFLRQLLTLQQRRGVLSRHLRRLCHARVHAAARGGGRRCSQQIPLLVQIFCSYLPCAVSLYGLQPSLRPARHGGRLHRRDARYGR